MITRVIIMIAMTTNNTNKLRYLIYKNNDRSG